MPKLSRYISHETDISPGGIVFQEGEAPKIDNRTSQSLRHGSKQLLTKVRGTFSTRSRGTNIS